MTVRPLPGRCRSTLRRIRNRPGCAAPDTTDTLGPPVTTEAISLREAAQRLGVHYMTAYRYVRTARLPARRDGQEWLIDPSDLSLLPDQAAVDRVAADRSAGPDQRCTRRAHGESWDPGTYLV